MARNYVFLVHGMGKQEEGEWHKPFVQSIVSAMKLYEPFAPLDAEEIEQEHICFKPISFDSVVDGFRVRWKALTDNVAEKIGEESEEAGKLFARFSESAGEDEDFEGFFWTHILDPLLWYVFPEARKAIIARVNRQIGDGLKEMYEIERTNRAHLLAHSLGTSVIHDSLVALRFWTEHEGLFNPKTFRWLTVGMVANVSRLLESRFKIDSHLHREAFKVYRSAMKPGGPESVVENFVNVHHRLDPFTWPRHFKPGDWPTYAYSDVETERFDDPKNIHDFEHYFANPSVHLPLLRLITGRLELGNPNETAKAWADFRSAYSFSTTQIFDNLSGLFKNDRDRKISTATRIKYLYEVFKALEKKIGEDE